MFKFVFHATFALVFADFGSTNVELTIDDLSTFAKVNQFPHIVAVLGDNGYEFKCSGTIVDEFTVLCAANCVDNRNRSSREIVSILAGTSSLVLGGVRRNVFIAFIEKDDNFLKDIAMLRLEKPLKFSESIKPIEVSTKNIVQGDEIDIVSWALKLSPTDDLLGRIKFFKVKAIGKENCGKNDSAKVICLGDLEGKNQKVNVTSVCKGYFRGSAFHRNKLIGFGIPKLAPTCIAPLMTAPSADSMSKAIEQFEKDFGFDN